MNENNFKIKLKKNVLQKSDLILLQKEFEAGTISQKQLSEEQKQALEKLYNEQIKELDTKIKNKKMELFNQIKIVNTYYKKAIDFNEKK